MAGMNTTQIKGFRKMAESMSAVERVMTCAEMAAASWGRVHQDINIDPTGQRWVYDARRNVFVAY